MKSIIMSLIGSASAVALTSYNTHKLAYFVNKIEGPQDLVQLEGIDSDLPSDSNLPAALAQQIAADRAMMPSRLETMDIAEKLDKANDDDDLAFQLGQVHKGFGIEGEIDNLYN